MSKELTAIYFRWLNQVAEDPEQTPAALCISNISAATA